MTKTNTIARGACIQKKRKAPAAVGKREASTTADTEVSATPKRSSNGAAVLAMLRSETGTTIADIMAATQWQAHSARGFLSGTIKKKLGLEIVKFKAANGKSVYRIATPAVADAGPPESSAPDLGISEDTDNTALWRTETTNNAALANGEA